MSKQIYNVPATAEGDDGEPYDDEEGYEYIDSRATEEYTAPEPGTGLFSTPARTITLVFSVLLLFVVVSLVAWTLGKGTDTSAQRPIPQSNGNGKLTPVPDIVKINVGYNKKPDGVTEATKVGSLPPNFQWTDNKTGKVMTLESLQGKPVLMNFWGTWCPPCRAEMPAMQEIYNRLEDKVVFLGISMGPRDEPLGVSQFVQLGNYSWDFIHDPNSDVMNRYQVTGIPSTYFIGRDGIIKAIHVGGADSQILEDNLAKAQQ